MTEQPTSVDPIYHITTHEIWSALGDRVRYSAPSLDEEGFIHCSRIDQLERSMNRFFANESSVIVLTIDPQLLEAELRYEEADNAMFPHIYGELNVTAVTVVEIVSKGSDGRFSYPPAH